MRLRALYLALSLALAGCYTQPHTRAGLDRRGAPQISQVGDVKTPAKAAVTTSQTTLVIPAGSVVTGPGANYAGVSQRDGSIAADDGRVTPGGRAAWSVTLSKPAELRTETRREAVEGAETPTPPPPPSPSDLARATGIRWFYLAGVASAILAGVLIWRGYPIAALKVAAAAVAFPLVGNFVSEKWAIVAGGVLLLMAGAVVLAWKIIARRHGLTKPL